MNLCSIKTVKALLARHSTDTKKGFGQNFLINPAIPSDIADESFEYHLDSTRRESSPSYVLEIGPGVGALTVELCQRYDKVIAVEIDKSLIPILDETLADYENVTVINEDFLKLDLDALLAEHFSDGRVSVCANLPYYITTPIIMRLLENARGKIASITVMVQKEVAERLCASSKDSEYGAITASVNYYGTVRELFDVAPANFLPPPSVTSTVIRIELFKECPYSVLDEKTLFEVIAGAFAQRRKTLLNSLSSSIGWVSKQRLGEIITSLGFDISVRGERLSINDFCSLANELYKEKTK